MTETFSKRLTTLMYERNMLQKELARELQVCEATVTHWIHGSHVPKRIEDFKAVAQLFGVTVGYLIGETD